MLDWLLRADLYPNWLIALMLAALVAAGIDLCRR